MEYLYLIIILALVFDFINGFHDSANSIATVVSTKVLSPFSAVLWAAFFNFVAFLFFGLHVANTIGKGVVDPSVINLDIIFAGVVGAIVWGLVTWFYGIPSSSSHALVGGLVGAAITGVSVDAVVAKGLIKIVIFIFISPILGMLLAYLISTVVTSICRNVSPSAVDKHFRRLQLFSAAAYSLGHGGNDAQKSMGIIAVALFTAGKLGETFYVPFWVVIACHIAMGVGTLFGGWRIVHTMGQKITRLKPFEGFCAETAGAMTLFGTLIFGIPVSTTHTITGAIVGVGMKRRLSAVRWGTTRNILWAWIFTIPMSGLIAAGAYLVISII